MTGAATRPVIGGGITIALGIAWLVIGWGLLTAKGWAWIITVILAIISAIISVIGIGGGAVVTHVIILIIDIVILYYLYRPNVKSYYGRIRFQSRGSCITWQQKPKVVFSMENVYTFTSASN